MADTPTTSSPDLLSQVSQSYVNLENAIEALFTTAGTGSNTGSNNNSNNSAATDALAQIIYNENVAVTKILNDAVARGV